MSENKLKIIVAHPGRQHSFRVATALKREGLLFKYVTTVYNKDTSLLMKIAKLFLNKENLERANNRRNVDLNDNDIVQFDAVLGYLLLLALRLDKSKKFYLLLDSIIKKSFGKKVAKYAIKNKADMIICFDTNALYCFRYLEKKKGTMIIRVIDHAHPPRNYLHLFIIKSN